MGNVVNLDEFNGVKSTLIDQGTPPPAVTISRNRTFIYGTAKQGPKGVPVVVNDVTVEQIFGAVPTDATFDTSLVRGYYEYKNSSSGPIDVALVRVGDVTTAQAYLYENTYIASGDLAYTLVNGHPAYSMWLKYLKDGGDGNLTKLSITEGADGFPSSFGVTLPGGEAVRFNLSKYPGAPGVASSVAELVALINANAVLSAEVVAGYDAIATDTSITITALSGTIVQTLYDLNTSTANKSFGDKLISIGSAYKTVQISGDIAAGTTVAELDIAPTKVMEATPTIDSFIRMAELEEILAVTALQAGATSIVKNLYCKTVTGWDNSYLITGGTGFKLYVVRNGSSVYTQLEATKYTVNTTQGTVTITETLAVGDRYFVSYEYKVSCTEAKRRSELVVGSDRSYFVIGSSIVFGAAVPARTYVIYTTKVYYSDTDLVIRDARNAIIEFVNAANRPSIGDTVTLTVNHQPELPAATGKVLVGSVVQPGSLSGGSDGRVTSKLDYTKAVTEAFDSVSLYPRRRNIVMGMYLDDTVQGYNEETGMLETKALVMHEQVLPYVESASNLTNECELLIPVRPLATLTQSEINTWIDKLTNNSSADLTRPANIIDGVNNFRADAPLGVMIVSIGKINGGAPYFANPACVYGAYKAQLSYKESAVHGFLPGTVRDLGVKIFNAGVISKLNAKRYTTAILDMNGRFIWADAPTLGIKYRSQYDRQFVRDTVYLAVALAREAAQKYIGKPRKVQFIVSMKNDIGKAISTLIPDVIGDVYVDVVPTADGYITGRTKLALSLTTSKELRGVDLETTITLV